MTTPGEPGAGGVEPGAHELRPGAEGVEDGHLGPGMGRGRWVLVGVGLVLVGVGAVLALQAVVQPRDLLSVAAWVLGPALLSDLVLMPVAAALAWLTRRRLARAWRTPVVVGLVLTATLLAVGWPFLGGFGRQAANPSLLDRPYWLGLAGYLLVLWAGVVLAGVVLTGVRRRRAAPAVVDRNG